MIKTIKKIIINSIQSFRSDVTIRMQGGTDLHTIFEGKNVLNNGCIYQSYVGYGTYISGGTSLLKVKIGKYSSIGQNVKNKLGIHPTDYIATHPAFYSVQKQAGFSFVSKNSFDEHRYADDLGKFLNIIGNDVWIGNNVVLMDGVVIGDGAIIGTNAVVTKNVEPYAVVGGVPAKLIRYRFSPDEIARLLQLQWWNFCPEILKINAAYFKSINHLNELETHLK